MIFISVLFLVFLLLVLLLFLLFFGSRLLRLSFDLFSILALVHNCQVGVLLPALTAEELLDILCLLLQLVSLFLICADAISVEPFLTVVAASA